MPWMFNPRIVYIQLFHIQFLAYYLFISFPLLSSYMQLWNISGTFYYFLFDCFHSTWLSGLILFFPLSWTQVIRVDTMATLFVIVMSATKNRAWRWSSSLPNPSQLQFHFFLKIMATWAHCQLDTSEASGLQEGDLLSRFCHYVWSQHQNNKRDPQTIRNGISLYSIDLGTWEGKSTWILHNVPDVPGPV